jgi:GTP-binding protein
MFEIKEANFIGSYVKLDKCPTDNKPQYAFIGRSNVGKSSLINMLCAKKDLAKVSGTPGKTQTMNYFLIDKSWYIVDLPGYGYARISQTTRADWQKMINYFLKNNTQLQYLFVLIDAMIPPQKIDIDFVNKLGELSVPFAIVFTKIDRIKADDRKRNVADFNKELLNYWDELPPQFVTSSEKKVGRNEILQFITKTNDEFFELAK